MPSRGLALVTVLWVLVLLSLVAASFTRTIRTEINLTRNLIDNAEAEALADAGVYRAIHELLSPQSEGRLSPQIENLLTLSSEPAAARRRIERDLRSELGETFFPKAGDPFVDVWHTDGTVYVWSFGGGQVWVSIQDEADKIDLNAAPDELLRGLFLSAEWSGPDGETVGLDEREVDALVDAIRDFADEDDLSQIDRRVSDGVATFDDDTHSALGLDQSWSEQTLRLAHQYPQFARDLAQQSSISRRLA